MKYRYFCLFSIGILCLVSIFFLSLPITIHAATAPDAPTNLAGASSNTQVSLSWTAPVSDGGSAITDYVIDYKLSSEPTVWSTFSDGVSTTTSGAVTGLTNGLSYDFRVSAVNAVGQGNASATATVALPIIYYWVGGATNTNTNNPANWSLTAGSCANSGNATLPSATDEVRFVSNCNNAATVNANLSVANFYIDTGHSAAVTLSSATLTTTGILQVSAGTLALGTNNVTAATTTLVAGTISGTTGVLTGSYYDVQSGTISAIVAGSGVVMTKTTSGTVTLSAGNTFTGGLVIKAGTVLGTGNIAAFGAGSITLGDSSGGNNNATLHADISNLTMANPIILASNTTGILSVINYNGHWVYLSGGVTGNNNLVVSNGGGGGQITFSGGSINNVGMITNICSTANVVISSIIGPNVTGVIQNSSTSPLTLSGNNTFSSGLTILNGTVIGQTSNNAFGVGTVTLGDGAGGSKYATLQSTHQRNFANPIILASNTTGILTIFQNGDGDFTGGVTGSNNLTLKTNDPYGNQLRFSTGSINNSGTLTNSGTLGSNAPVIIYSVIGPNVTGVIQNSTSSTLTLSGNNTFSSGLTIKNGTVIGQTSANAFGSTTPGTGTITLGDSDGGTANAALRSGSNLTFVNPISVAAGSSGTLSIGSSNNGPIFSGAITLNNNLTVAPANNTDVTLRGGVTGTGNITISGTGSGGTMLSTGSVNNTGTITNSGSGTGNLTISSIIGTNVTGVVQNNSTSAMSLSGANTFTTGLTIKSGSVWGQTSANAFGANSSTVTIGDSTGGSSNATMQIIGSGLTFANPIILASNTTGILTIGKNSNTAATFSGGVTGTNNLVIKNSSTDGNNITFSTGSINNTGTITNSGTGTLAPVIINSVIGTNVQGIVQNGAGSPLTLSGVNTFTGPVTNSAGTLNLTQTTTYSTMTLAGDTTTTFTNGKTFTLTNLVSTGTSGHLATINSASAGNAATLSKSSGAVSVSYMSIKDSTATGGATWRATNSTNVSGNSGWGFGPVDAYWVGGAGNWSDAATHWATASGGTAGVGNFPGSATNVHFDASSGTGTVTVDSSVSVTNFDESSANIIISPGTNLVTISGTFGVSGTLNIGASNFASNYSATPTLNTGSTVNYSAAGNQNVLGTLSYINLTTSGSGTKSLAGAITVLGNLTISTGTTLDTKSLVVGDGTGGTITHDGSYTVHTFNSSGTFTPSAGLSSVAALVVGGGGGAGGNGGGGGGGGGLIYNSSYAVSGATSVTVGGGGAGQVNSAPNNGVSSVFGTLTAVGGGGGGSRDLNSNGLTGGSGGGGSSSGTYGSATSGQGNIGGAGYNNGCPSTGGGGGGSSSVGVAGANNVAGNGGGGTSNSISGSAVTYAGGGGGGVTCAGGTGGTATGGGGNGSAGTGVGTAGTVNTGGGGGGSGGGGGGGNGGSGIVIVRYLTPTGTPNNNISVGGNFSNSGTFTANQSTVTFTSGTHTITGANTFYNLTASSSNTVTFPAATTQTIGGNFSCTGTAGNPITINSSVPTSQATLSMGAGKTANCDYLVLTDSAATGGATWIAGANYVNGPSNSGWTGGLVAPDAPTGLTLTTSSGQGNLSWTAPVNNGGLEITDYVLDYKLTSEPTVWSTFADGVSTSTSGAITGLINGSQYDFRVSAVNSAGQGSASSVVTVALPIIYYWVGGSTNSNTNNAANWSLTAGSCANSANATVPSTADEVRFVSNCNNAATVNANLSVANFYIDTGHSAAVTLSSATLTVATTTQISAGTLALGSNNITAATTTLISGTISGSTGVMTATSYAVQSGTISAILAGTSAVMTKTTSGTLTLSGANTFTGGLIIKAGTVVGQTSASAFGGSGTGTITLGDSAGGSNAATLNGYASLTFANPIVLASNTTGTLTITTRDSFPATFTGGVTGNNSFTINNPTTNGNFLTFSTGSINNVGTVTNASTGSAAPVYIYSIIGTNVTGVIQNSSTSVLTLTGNNTFSGNGLTILNGTVSGLINTTAFGAGNVTLGDGTGGNNNATLTVAGSSGGTGTFTNPIVLASTTTGTLTVGNNSMNGAIYSGGVTGNNNLTINNPSTNNHGVTLSSTTVNNIGTVTNSGTGSASPVTISSVIGANVTGVIQNSSTSVMTLSGNNTFSSGLTILKGTVIGQTSANAFGSTTPGTGIITIGDSSGSANVSLQAKGALTFNNPITTASGNSGIMTITNVNLAGAAIFKGAIILNKDLTLKQQDQNNSLTFSGGVTGTGNLIVNISSNAGGTAGLTLSGNDINMTGSLNNYSTANGNGNQNGGGIVTISASVGSNVTGIDLNTVTTATTLSGSSINPTGSITNRSATTQTSSISGVIGSNVTGVIQNSSTSPMTLSGNNTFSSGLTILKGTVAGSRATAFGSTTPGTGTITLGDSSGGSNSATLSVNTNSLTLANPIILASNTTGTLTIQGSPADVFSGGVTGNNSFVIGNNDPTVFSTNAINNAGTITSLGNTNISSVIGPNVTGLIQNGTGKSLILSGTGSVVSGNVTITAGTLALSGTTALGVTGNWSNSGTFTANQSTVTLRSGAHTITGANTFYNLTASSSNTITLPAGTTQTISNAFSCTGTSGHTITINSSVPTSQATLSMGAGKTANCDWLMLTDNNATGDATWNAGANSMIYTNVTGWTGGITVPDAPGAPAPTPNNGQVALAWSAPANNGSAITDYVVEYKLTSEPTVWSVVSDGVSAGTTASVTGLTNGLSYDFRVAAVNIAGQGSASAPASATPATVPDAPTIGTATAGNAQATVSFTPLTTATSTAWYNSSWGYRARVTVNSGQATTTQSNFPVYVNLANLPAGFWSRVRSDGGDIRVTNGAGTELAREVVTINTGASTGELWFKGDSVYSGASYNIYYGNAGASDYASTTTYGSQKVWDEGGSNYYKGVWHLPNGTSLTANDSTGNGNNGTLSSPAPTATTGQIDGAGSFNGVSNYVVNSNSIVPTNGDFTIGLWAKQSTVSGILFGIGSASSAGWSLRMGLDISYFVTGGLGTLEYPDLSTNVWHHLVMTRSGNLFQIYLDGVMSTSTSSSGSLRGNTYTMIGAGPGRFYAPPYYQEAYSNAIIDETYIAGTARSATWIATEYNNQSASNTFYNVAGQESFSGSPTNGGSAVTAYTVTSNPGNFTSASSTSPITVTGLTNGTSYTFTVTATNAVGVGAPSAQSNSVTPATVPDAPTAVSATVGNTQITLRWTPPVWNGGASISDYVAEYKLNSTSTWSVFADAVSTATSTTVTGLTNGSLYNFRVSAVNSAGQGTSSATVNSTPITVPSAPTSVVATRGNTQATVTFTAPANGGSAITSYTITSSPGSISTTTTTTSGVVTGLTNGTAYTFTVTATNAAGTGPSSSASNSVTPATTPDAPTSPVATAGNAQVSVAFTAPASNGGSAITGYTVTSSPGGYVSTGSASPIVVTGLLNGTVYTFAVTATNAVGVGSASVSSNSVTPVTVPSAPTIGTATAGNAQASVTFVPLALAPTSTAWYNASWGNRKKITIDHTKVGNGTTDQSNFPVLVSLTGLSNISANGADIRFTSSDGTTELSREIESYSAGTLVAWVKIPTLSHTADTDIYMYYGNAGASEPVASATYGSQSVWNDGGSNYFKGVWHLPNGTSLSANDSTSNANNGTFSTTPPTATSGKIDGAGSFNGVNNYILAGNDASLKLSGGSMTLSAWTYTGTTDKQYFIYHGLGCSTWSSYYLSIGGNEDTNLTNKYAFGFGTGNTSTNNNLGSVGNAMTNQWVLVTATYNGSLLSLYLNGVLNNTVSGSGSPWNSAEKLSIGADPGCGMRGKMNGSIDNLSISGVARSADWIATEYNNQSSPSTFYQTAGEETYSAPVANDGGSAVTSYTVTSSPGNFTGTGSASPIVVAGLTNGTPYTFTVTATNAVGTGVASAPSNSVVPVTVPDAPTALAPTAGAGQVGLSWTAPVYNGGGAITDYVIEYKKTASSTWSTFADGTSAGTTGAVTGLTNGLSYDFRVSAVNVAGQGVPSSEVSSMPVTVPDAPTDASAVPGNAQATVTFTAPAFNGGSAVTSYTITSSPGNISTTTTSTSGVVTGLTNGTAYTFTVTANNAVGAGLASVASSPVIPVTIPTAPTAVSASEGNTQATVSFTAPASDGGTAILDYTITATPGNISTTTTSTTGVVTGLTNGTTYTFVVTARNAVGTGPESSPSNAVRLSTEPTAPGNLASVVLGSSISLSWSAPVSNGGTAITDYIIEYQLTTGGTWTVFADATSINTTALVNGLSNRTSYDFRVSAVNIIGQSLPSNVVSATPGEPAQVLIQNFTDLTNPSIGTAVRITNEGSIEYEYQYTWCVTDSAENVCGGGDDVFSATAAKLIQSEENWDTTLNSVVPTPGNYYFHINVVYGSQSSSAYQSFTAVPTFPDAPTAVTATSSNAQATVSFNAPASNGGSVITGYTVTSGPGGLTGTGSASPITVTGLTNGTQYSFTVTATNGVGVGPASSPSNSVIPMTIPNAPTGLTATAGNTEVALSWVAPLIDGGSAITDYVVEYKLSSEPTTWTVFADGVGAVTTATVTGLTNNLTYDFRVSAVNAVGQSAVNSSSASPASPAIPPSGGSGSHGGSRGGNYVPPTSTSTTPTVPINVPTPTVPAPTNPTTPTSPTAPTTPTQPNQPSQPNEISATPVEHPVKIPTTPTAPTYPTTGESGGLGYWWILIIASGVGVLAFVGWLIFFIRRRLAEDANREVNNDVNM